MKTFVKLVYLLLAPLVKPFIVLAVGVTLTQVFPSGVWHVIGLILFWGAIVYAVVLELMLAVLIWLKRDEQKFWNQLHRNGKAVR